MRRPVSTLRIAITAATLAAALGALGAVGVAAAASPTLLRAPGVASSGGPGATLRYTYTWDYADCSANSPDPGSLTIVLAWDDAATTPVGFAPITINKGGNVCQGVVSGQVPSNATPGDHFPSASLKEPSSRGNTIVKNSDSGRVFAGQQFTVNLPATPTPSPTPSPTPTDTPQPTDTSIAATPAPSDTPAASATASAPLAAGTGGGSGPPTALLVAIAAIVLIGAAIAATVLARRRRARADAADPFEFLR